MTTILATLVLLTSAQATSTQGVPTQSTHGANPWNIRIAREGEPGIPMIVKGTIVDLEGRPLPGVKLAINHTDAKGDYGPGGEENARLNGVLWTNSEGRFEFQTIRPGRYPGWARGEHFHMTLSEGGVVHQMARIDFFEDRPEKLVLLVGRRGGATRRDTHFAWKPDPSIHGQRLEVILRAERASAN